MALDNVRPFRNSSQEPPQEPPDYEDEHGEQEPRRDFSIDVGKKNIAAIAHTAWLGVREFNKAPHFYNNPYLYVRDGMMVELQLTQRSGEPNGIKIVPVTLDRMTGVIGRSTYWFNWVKKGDEFVAKEVFPHSTVVRDMFSNPHPPLPRIDRIVAAPVFNPDGGLSMAPGYDRDTMTYYHPTSEQPIPKVPPIPTEDEVAEAVAIINELIEEFPFVDAADRCHTISMMLNPFVRAMINGPTPMYMIEAPSQGTGKGLLAEACLTPALARQPQVMIPTSNDEEMRKRMFAIVSDGHEAVLIDNIDKTINSAELATILTTGMVSDRVLGTSRTQTYRVRNTWVATGNNPTMNQDIFRRTVRIRLNANVERPEERVFKKEVIEWGKQNRHRLIWACLTMVQNWVASGMKPPTENGATIGSFERWAIVHGGILEAANLYGFLTNRKETDSLSVEDQSIPVFIEAWFARYGSTIVHGTELLEIAKTIPGFPMRGNNELALAQSFGKKMESLRDRVYGYLQVHREPKSNQGARWSLQTQQMQMDFE